MITRKILTTMLPAVAALGLILSACAPPQAGAPTEAPTEASNQPAPEAAATNEPSPEPIMLTDSLGHIVTLEAAAQRIISLAPSNTEILYSIGAGSQLVGRDEFSDYPPEASEVQSIGSTFGDLSPEPIVALEPDLVLAAAISPEEQIQTLLDIGLQVFVIANPTDFEGLYANIQQVGILTGHQADANALVDEMKTRVEAVTAAVEGSEPPKVFYEVDGSDPTAPWTTGTGTFQQMMFDLARGENISADIQGWAQLSLEEIVERDPAVIIFGTASFVPTSVETLSARAGWGEISAVEMGQVYGVNTDWTDLPGPRLVNGLEAIARILHPDRFEQ